MYIFALTGASNFSFLRNGSEHYPAKNFGQKKKLISVRSFVKGKYKCQTVPVCHLSLNPLPDDIF